MADTPEVSISQRHRVERVFPRILEERKRQISKWGGIEGDGIESSHSNDGIRLRVLAEEFGEVAEALGRVEDGNGKHDLETELVQVAAVCVAWLEYLDVFVGRREPYRIQARKALYKCQPH